MPQVQTRTDYVRQRCGEKMIEQITFYYGGVVFYLCLFTAFTIFLALALTQSLTSIIYTLGYWVDFIDFAHQKRKKTKEAKKE